MTADPALEKRYYNDSTTTVLGDAKMRWGIPGLEEPFPDISVIPHVKDMDNLVNGFEVIEQGDPSLPYCRNHDTLVYE